MIINDYKGFKIEVKKEQALGGWDQILYLIMRLEDGYFLRDDFHYGEYGTVSQVMKECKWIVDRYLEDPEEWAE